MNKLLQFKIILLLFTIFSFFVYNPINAQIGCPATSNINATTGVGQLNLSWPAVLGTSAYDVNVAFDDGTSYNGLVSGTSVAVSYGANVTSANVSITSVCADGELGGKKKTHIIITQGDINSLDCSLNSEQIEAVCKEIAELPKSTSITILFKKSLCPPIHTTAGAFAEKHKCNKMGIKDNYDNGNRLPSDVPTKVVPNPFNNDFGIQFSMSTNAKLSINLYSSNGQLIKPLVDQEMTDAGIHDLRFDASDLPAGVYFIRMNIEDNTTVHKLVKIE